MVLWLTGHPTHLAGRLHIAIEPLAVLTAVSYPVLVVMSAVGGRISPRGGQKHICSRVVRRESGVLCGTGYPTHLARRLRIVFDPLAVFTGVWYHMGGV